MKKLLLALVLIVPAFAFTGCGGEEDEPTDGNIENNLAATWSVIERSSNGAMAVIQREALTYTFNPDHTYRVRYYDEGGLRGDYRVYGGVWKADGHIINGTTDDAMTETFEFPPVISNDILVNYSNSKGNKSIFRVLKSGGNSGIYSKDELESIPSFMRDERRNDDKNNYYISFSSGHATYRTVTEDGKITITGGFDYLIAGEQITAIQGNKRSEGIIKKIKFSDGTPGIDINIVGWATSMHKYRVSDKKF